MAPEKSMPADIAGVAPGLHALAAREALLYKLPAQQGVGPGNHRLLYGYMSPGKAWMRTTQP